MEPITVNEALEIIFEALDGKDISWEEIKRAKEILKIYFKEASK